MLYLLIILAIWIVLSAVLGVIVGQAIALGQRVPPQAPVRTCSDHEAA